MPCSQLWVPLGWLPQAAWCTLWMRSWPWGAQCQRSWWLQEEEGNCARELQCPDPAGIMHHLLRAHTGAHLTISTKCCACCWVGFSREPQPAPHISQAISNYHVTGWYTAQGDFHKSLKLLYFSWMFLLVELVCWSSQRSNAKGQKQHITK